MKYYRHFPGDYLRDTMDLTLEEEGVYRRLLDWQYLHEEPIRSYDHACRICRTRNGASCVARVLHAFFHLQEDGYVNARFLKEQAHYLGISSKRRLAALAKQMHARMSHNPETRKRRTTNIELSQAHAAGAAVENSENPVLVGEEKNLPDVLRELNEGIAKLNGGHAMTPEQRKELAEKISERKRRGLL